MAVLCDGKSFYFFNFMDRRRTRSEVPQLTVGQFGNNDWRQYVLGMQHDNPTAFVRQTRRISESLFYVFLSGYRAGLEAYWNFSVEKGRAQGREKRQSTPGWHKAMTLAGEALEVAKLASVQLEENKVAESKESAEKALKLLAERYVLC